MTTWLKQTERFLQIETPLGKDIISLVEFQCEESISNLFQFTLSLISGTTHIEPDQLIGKPVSIKLKFSENDSPRYFHGIVTHFSSGLIQNGIRSYSAILKPWLNFLRYTSDCQIFQNKNVIAITKKIFNELTFRDYDMSGLTKSYPSRDYCVQYNETAFDFLNRLFEEEGIFYFFRHQQNKHILVLADNPKNLNYCTSEKVQFSNGTLRKNHLTRWERNNAFHSGKFTQTDYNFESPNISLKTEQSRQTKLIAAQKYERYQYPGRYQNLSEGKKNTQQNFESHECQYEKFSGEGNYIKFSPAEKFSLSNSPTPNDDGDYIVTSIIHHAIDETWFHGSTGSQTYHNYFECISNKTHYLPLPSSKKPVIHGAQTAIVVASSSEEIYTNKFACVKVQFHWDRKGKKNDESSCWIRVAQTIAGNQWGTLFMPRVGQEVIVQFLEGNPDRPIILGCVYNASNLPPYSLPSEQSQSGFKTRSLKNELSDCSNELRFDDKSGSEEIYIHAQKNFKQKIKHNLLIDVDNEKVVHAKNLIRFKVDENSLELNHDGIFINGKKVCINE